MAPAGGPQKARDIVAKIVPRTGVPGELRSFARVSRAKPSDSTGLQRAFPGTQPASGRSVLSVNAPDEGDALEHRCFTWNLGVTPKSSGMRPSSPHVLRLCVHAGRAAAPYLTLARAAAWHPHGQEQRAKACLPCGLPRRPADAARLWPRIGVSGSGILSSPCAAERTISAATPGRVRRLARSRKY